MRTIRWNCGATARMTHSFALGQMLGRPGRGPLPDDGIAALRERFRDRSHGGWYGPVGPVGVVVDQSEGDLWAVVLRDRDRAVECDDRRWVEPGQLVVQCDHLRPVRVRSGGSRHCSSAPVSRGYPGGSASAFASACSTPVGWSVSCGSCPSWPATF